MHEPPTAPLGRVLRELQARDEPPSRDDVLEAFLDFVIELGFELYPDQEEAMLELLEHTPLLIDGCKFFSFSINPPHHLQALSTPEYTRAPNSLQSISRSRCSRSASGFPGSRSSAPFRSSSSISSIIPTGKSAV